MWTAAGPYMLGKQSDGAGMKRTSDAPPCHRLNTGIHDTKALTPLHSGPPPQQVKLNA
jgi:hypothetical protein